MAVYDEIGRTYARTRRADPRIAARIVAALGGAASVLSVGAGSGNYEPTDRRVIALEPSMTVIRQRPAGAAVVVQGVAGDLPFVDRSFDVAMGTLTLHHWPDLGAGPAEVRRVRVLELVVRAANVKPVEVGVVEADERVEHSLHDRAGLSPHERCRR